MKGNGGFVCLWRSLLGHPAFRNEGEAMAFGWLVLNAQWKPARVRYKERIFHLQRGQLAVSVRDMARRLERSRSWVERFLNRLKIETMVETQAETGVTIITVCNYSLYQDKPPEAETQAETGGEPVPRQGRDTEQQSKQIKQDSRAKAQTTRTYLPDDWKPPAIADLPPKAREAARQWPRAAYEAQAESFALYWRAERKTKADWPATWANWIHRSHWRVMQDARRQPARDGNGDGKKLYQRMAEERAGRA